MANPVIILWGYFIKKAPENPELFLTDIMEGL